MSARTKVVFEVFGRNRKYGMYFGSRGTEFTNLADAEMSASNAVAHGLDVRIVEVTRRIVYQKSGSALSGASAPGDQ